MSNNFIYHHAENYTLIMTTGGEAICTASIDDYSKNSGCIHNLHVVEKERRKGYGNMILAESEKELLRRGVKVVSLSAVKDSFMEKWYKRKGYTPLFSDSNYVTFFKQINKTSINNCDMT